LSMSRKKVKAIKREIQHIKASYDAAATTNNNINQWKYTDGLSANDANSEGVRTELRQRSRYEGANNCHLRGAMDRVARDTVGTGPKLEFAKDNDVLNALRNDWKAWCKEIRFAKRLQLMRKAKQQDGEVFGKKFSNKNLRNKVSLDFQLMEAQWVESHFNNKTDIDGIWTDENGYPSHYNVLTAQTKGGSYAKSKGVRTPAADIIHYAYTTRPGQIRGIPETTPALPIFVQLRAYTLSVLAAAETAANHALLLETDGGADEAPDLVDAFTSFEMERNMMKALPYGWKAKQLKAEQPSTGYKDFKGALLNEAGVCMALPFNIIAGNSSGYNFSSGRLDHTGYYASIDDERAVEIEPVIVDDLFADYSREWFAVTGNRPQETNHSWVWPAHASIDPEKTAKAQTRRLENKTSNLEMECAQEGHDWEKVVDQALLEEQYEQEQRKQLHLPQYNKSAEIIEEEGDDAEEKED